MIPRKFRLPASIRFSHASSASTPEFICKWQENSLPLCRFGCICSKTVDKKAVARNKLKRMVRSILEEKWLQEKGWDVLFILRPKIKETTKENLRNEVDSTMQQLLKKPKVLK